RVHVRVGRADRLRRGPARGVPSGTNRGQGTASRQGGMSRWISETLFPGARLSFEAERVLLDESGPGQRVQLIENGIFGKVLMLDGAVQLTSADEFIYHEMMAHVPLLAHGAARDVLIVGGGDCGL